MPYTVVTAAVTVTPTSSPTMVVVTTTIAASDLSRFSITPTSLPTATAAAPQTSSGSSSATGSSSSSNGNGTSNEASLVGAVAGGLLGGFAFFTLVIVMACLNWRRTKKGRGVGAGKGTIPSQRGRKSASAAGTGVGASGAGGTENAAMLVDSNGNATATNAFWPSRPVRHGRADPHSRSGSSALVPLMAGAGAPLSHVATSSDHYGAHTPSSSMNGRYSLLSVHPSYASYDNFEPYGMDAVAPSSGAEPTPPLSVYNRTSEHQAQASSSTLPMARHHPEGMTSTTAIPPSAHRSVALSRPPSSSTLPQGATRPMSAGSSEGNFTGPSHSQSHSAALRPPTRQDRPISSGSSNSTSPWNSAGNHSSPAYMTSAAAYAIPALAGAPSASHEQAAARERRAAHQQQRLPPPSRPPAAGLPIRSSTLSTIQGSEKTPTERSDSMRGGSIASSGTVRQSEGAASAPRLPSIPASSPLVVQNALLASTDGRGGQAGTPREDSGVAPSRLAPDPATDASQGKATGTLDSTGTFNTLTGLRKGVLHVVGGTLSSQNSSLPPAEDSRDEHGSEAWGNEAGAPKVEGRPQPSLEQPRDTWSVDSQGLEFWLRSERSEDNDRRGSAITAGSGSNPSGAATPVAAPGGTGNAGTGHQRGAKNLSTGSARGSRLIEMFDGSDSGDHFSMLKELSETPSLPKATGLGRARRDRSAADIDATAANNANDNNENENDNDSTIPLQTSPSQVKHSSSFANLLGLSPKSPKKVLPDEAPASPSVGPSGPAQNLKHTSSSPLLHLGFRLGKGTKPAEAPAPESSHGDQPSATNATASAKASQLGSEKLPSLQTSADMGHVSSVPGLNPPMLAQLWPQDIGTTNSGLAWQSGAAETSDRANSKTPLTRLTPSRDGQMVLGDDFFCSAFSQPLTIAATDAALRHGHAPVIVGAPAQHQAVLLPSKNARKETRFKPKKGAAKANEIDIDQLF
ncbi:hypothetical protein ACQY0O_007997 [Thecaphora frezii]